MCTVHKKSVMNEPPCNRNTCLTYTLQTCSLPRRISTPDKSIIHKHCCNYFFNNTNYKKINILYNLNKNCSKSWSFKTYFVRRISWWWCPDRCSGERRVPGAQASSRVDRAVTLKNLLFSLDVFQKGWLRKKEEDMLEVDHMVLGKRGENALESEVTELQRWAVARDNYKSETDLKWSEYFGFSGIETPQTSMAAEMPRC